MKKRTDLLNYIDFPLFSFEVGVIKPNLKIFKEMLKITNIKPKECIMIGDKLNDDVIPPRKINMNSILYIDYENLKKELKKYSILI